MNEILFVKINMLAGQNIWLDRFMIFSAEYLGYFLILLLLVPLMIPLFIKNSRISNGLKNLILKHTYYGKMIFVAFISAVVARFVFVEIIRFFYYSPRPFLVLSDVNQLINHETTSSFPSGHAAFYFALAAGVYLYNKKLGKIYFVATALIAFARIFAKIV